MAEKDQRFALVMTVEESKALDSLAQMERISKAAVLRRLIWTAATNAGQPAHANEVTR